MDRPEIVLVAAMAERNRVIGRDNALPWHISEDLKRFKQLTLGHAVLMGRKTFESIVARLGKPLPERRNVVLSRTRNFDQFPEVETHASLGEALKALLNETTVYVIGGEAVFRETLPLARRLELTLIEGAYDGDAFFPPFEEQTFRLAHEDPREGYRFQTYVKARGAQ